MESFLVGGNGVGRRKLTYTDAAKSNRSGTFNNKYLYVSVWDYTNDIVYKVIEIPDLFEKVTFDIETQTLDLGEDWEKYVYYYTDSPENYPPESFVQTSRTITKYAEGGERQNTFEGKYLYVMLRANEESYRLIETTVE